MSVNLLKKSILIYKPIFVWNILVSSLTSYFFVIKEFNGPDVYSWAIFIKLIGWAFSVGLYAMFYQSTSYFFNNQGISFKKIMSNLIFYDLALLAAILIILFICLNFL